jgi:hypothetical protein
MSLLRSCGSYRTGGSRKSLVSRKAIILGLVLMTPLALALAGVEDLDQDIPISISTFVNPTNRKNDKIPLAVTIENGMKGSITFGSFSLEAVEWNGETASLTLVDIYRNGEPGGLFLERPKIRAPYETQSMSHFVLKRGQGLTLKTDIAKWKIKGGWVPGRYTITLRVENLTTERGRHTISVLSEPFSFEILP